MQSVLERAACVLALATLGACAQPAGGDDSSNDNGAVPGAGSGGASGFANVGSGGTSGSLLPGDNQAPGGDGVAGPGNGGNVAAGSGGSSGGANAGGGATDNTGSGGASGGGDMAAGGAYVTAGDWHGYAWPSASGTGTTIAPMAFMGIASGDPLCISGTVAPATNYSGIAMIGVNVNQARVGNDTPHPVTTGQAGLAVSVTNHGNAQLRVQIQGANGGSDENDRWCVPLSGSGGFYTWGSFNTKCWDNTGNDYKGEDIVAVMVTVPGDDVDPVAYDFCLNSAMQADSAGGGAGSGGDNGGGTIDPGNNSGSGTLTMPLEWKPVMRDGRNYVVQNNVWGGSSTQNVNYSGTTFEVTQQTGSNQTDMGPVSYPSVFIGSNNSRNTAGSNLPKQVSALSTVDTAWSHNAGSVSGTYNAAYDVWFSTGAGGDGGSPSGGYLMVWLYDPDGAQPIGTRVDSSVSIDGASGSWDVWLGDNGGKPCISYVRISPATSLQFDLNKFIQHAVGRKDSVQSNWYLTNVFAGFEIWSGGVGLKTNAFYAIVN